MNEAAVCLNDDQVFEAISFVNELTQVRVASMLIMLLIR